MKVLILISFALSAAIVQVQAQVADPRVGNRNPLQGTLFTLSEASQVVDSWYDISGFGVVEVSNFPWLYGRQFGWIYVHETRAGLDSKAKWVWIDSLTGWYLFPGENDNYVWSDSSKQWNYFHIDSSGYGWLHRFSVGFIRFFPSWQRIPQFPFPSFPDFGGGIEIIDYPSRPGYGNGGFFEVGIGREPVASPSSQ